MPHRLPHSLRSDALDNRERLLDAARALFAEEGLDVPMRKVARSAGVGPATLYRRFPTKQALVTEAFGARMRACNAIVEEGLEDPDPWHGFRLVVENLCEVHARDRGFTEALMRTFPDAADFAADRAQALASLARLVARAKESGRLRRDLAVDDVVLTLMANRGIHAPSAAARIAASRRFAAFMLEAFRASPTHSPLPPPARLTAGAPRTQG
nr:TetR/AcrR family transcriptional regulator [Streptomyces xiaopingdaonensis]